MCYRTQNLAEIKSAHFTTCQKPWTCNPDRVRLCLELHDSWFNLRKEAEAFYGVKVVNKACRGESYVRMEINEARLPMNGILRVDDSPDFLRPIGNSGFN